MATFRKSNDELVNCPYNKNHWIRRSRLQAHMIKCREHCTEENKKICPFNATHCIPESEFQQHLGTCADKASVDKKVFEMKQNSTYKGRTTVPSYSAFKVLHEDWDDGFNNEGGCWALDKKEEIYTKSINTQLVDKLPTEKCVEYFIECSNQLEEKKNYLFQNSVSYNRETKDFMGIGRGQVILQHLSQSTNPNGIDHSKHQSKILVGRGRGLALNSSEFAYVEECHLANNEESVKSENWQLYNKSEENDSCDSSLACSSSELEDHGNSTFRYKDCNSLKNFIGIGRGKPVLKHNRQSADTKEIEKSINQVKIQNSNYENQIQADVCQNGRPMGRARGFVSNSRGRRLFMDNGKTVIGKEHHPKNTNILINEKSTEKLKYSIEHLPPCRPGEIRTVPLQCE